MEWISCEDRLPDKFAGIFKVKRKNGDEIDAHFYQDKMRRFAFYGIKPSYWWHVDFNTNSEEALFDITHWLQEE